MTDADSQALRDHGFSDRQIVDIALAAGARNYFSRALQALAVPVEDVPGPEPAARPRRCCRRSGADRRPVRVSVVDERLEQDEDAAERGREQSRWPGAARNAASTSRRRASPGFRGRPRRSISASQIAKSSSIDSGHAEEQHRDRGERDDQHPERVMNRSAEALRAAPPSRRSRQGGRACPRRRGRRRTRSRVTTTVISAFSEVPVRS